METQTQKTEPKLAKLYPKQRDEKGRYLPGHADEGAGRPEETPSIDHKDKVNKLEEAFAYDASIPEACFHAEISEATYYNWIQKEPNLLERFKQKRNRPVLKARKTAVDLLDTNYYTAMDYLKRKRPEEFGDHTQHTEVQFQLTARLEALGYERRLQLTRLINERLYGNQYAKITNGSGGVDQAVDSRGDRDDAGRDAEQFYSPASDQNGDGAVAGFQHSPLPAADLG